MIIKKFQGKTEEEATNQAKTELGTNAVIMNVRSVKKKGLFAFLKSPIVEVTAALEEENEKQSARKPEPVRTVPVSPDVIIEKENDTKEKKLIEEKLESIHSLIEKQLVRENESEEKTEKINEKPSEMVQFLKLIYNTLIENEVDEKYANELLDEIEKMNKPGLSIDSVLSNVYQKLILKFGQADTIEPAENGPRVSFFVGPTGVGKTTTIAKIASYFCVNEKKKVALITTDTYRISAAEQLRTYANILEVPFQVIYTAEELKEVYQKFNQYDYIFVDTAGHSPNNASLQDNTKQFTLSLIPDAQTDIFLVLSATTKYRDLLKIVETYAELFSYKLIFTKLDETSALGNLLNIRLKTGAAMSYVTCGQNVPDDISKFNPQTTVKQILGGK